MDPSTYFFLRKERNKCPRAASLRSARSRALRRGLRRGLDTTAVLAYYRMFESNRNRICTGTYL